MLPEIVHHIWADVPNRAERTPNWVTRQLSHWERRWLPAGWKHEVWTTDRVMDEPWARNIAVSAAALELPHRGLSDLLRWAILSRFGGLYLDIDVLPVGRIEEMLEQPTFCTAHGPGVQRLDQWGFSLPPEHPLPPLVLAHAAEQLQRGVRNEHFVAGPAATWQVWHAGDFADIRVIYDVRYANNARTRMAMMTGDLWGLPGTYPLQPTLGGRDE